MNIIANRCHGAYIYRDILKCEYQNPFVWSQIRKQSYNYLFSHYTDIDFSNIVVNKHAWDKTWCLDMLIDDVITVTYPHILFDARCNKPTIKANNVYYNRPWLVVCDSYKKRLTRMQQTPVFIYLDIDNNKLCENFELAKLANTLKRECLFITTREYEETEYVKTINVIQQDWSKQNWWNYIRAQHANQIVNYLICK